MRTIYEIPINYLKCETAAISNDLLSRVKKAFGSSFGIAFFESMVSSSLLARTPSVRISRRINASSNNISESTGVLNMPTTNGQASGDSSTTTEAAEFMKKFETSVFPPSPPPDETLLSVSSDVVDANSPVVGNHVGHVPTPVPEEVRVLLNLWLTLCKQLDVAKKNKREIAPRVFLWTGNREVKLRASGKRGTEILFM